jgi:hypothetical protein
MTEPRWLTQTCERRQLTVIRKLPGGKDDGAWLCADRAGRSLVLKGLPSPAVVAAYGAWDGRGAARTLFADDEAIALEFLADATPLSDTDDHDYADACVSVTEQLWRQPAPADVPDLSALCDRWAQTMPAPAWDRAWAQAQQHLAELLPCSERVLLHGDLHAGNILRAGGRWSAIDPQPAVGDRVYDVEPLLRRFLDAGRPDAAVSLLDTLGVPADRALLWATVRSVWYGAASSQVNDHRRAARWQRRLAQLEHARALTRPQSANTGADLADPALI